MALTAADRTKALARALAAAQSQIGVPYQWGKESPGIGFDCSGLIQWAYSKAGIALPRVAADQQRATTRISSADARPGDLVFYGDPAGHVGLYLGAGKMLAAPKTGDRVKIQAVYGSPTFGRVSDSAAAGAPISSGAPTSSDAGSSGVNPWLVGLVNPVAGLTTATLGNGKDPLGISSAVGMLGQVTAALVRAQLWVATPRNWVRVAEGAVGGVLIVTGAAIVARPAVAPVISAAVPVGRAVKAAKAVAG